MSDSSVSGSSSSVAVECGFMLDTSDSLKGETNLKVAIQLIQAVYSELTVSASGYHFGLVSFGSSASVVFDFKRYRG